MLKYNAEIKEAYNLQLMYTCCKTELVLFA